MILYGFNCSRLFYIPTSTLEIQYSSCGLCFIPLTLTKFTSLHYNTTLKNLICNHCSNLINVSQQRFVCRPFRYLNNTINQMFQSITDLTFSKTLFWEQIKIEIDQQYDVHPGRFIHSTDFPKYFNGFSQTQNIDFYGKFYILAWLHKAFIVYSDDEKEKYDIIFQLLPVCDSENFYILKFNINLSPNIRHFRHLLTQLFQTYRNCALKISNFSYYVFHSSCPYRTQKPSIILNVIPNTIISIIYKPEKGFGTLNNFLTCLRLNTVDCQLPFHVDVRWDKVIYHRIKPALVFKSCYCLCCRNCNIEYSSRPSEYINPFRCVCSMLAHNRCTRPVLDAPTRSNIKQDEITD